MNCKDFAWCVQHVGSVSISLYSCASDHSTHAQAESRMTQGLQSPGRCSEKSQMRFVCERTCTSLCDMQAGHSICHACDAYFWTTLSPCTLRSSGNHRSTTSVGGSASDDGPLVMINRFDWLASRRLPVNFGMKFQ